MNKCYASLVKSNRESGRKEIKKMEKIKERKEELKNNLSNTYCDCICDYNDGYICDAIYEISDNHVDIYYNDLFEWCKHNFEYVNKSLENFGSTGDIIKDIQGGQFEQICDELYENIEDMLLLFAYNYLYDNNIKLNNEELEELEENITALNHDNRLEDIIEMIEDIRNGDAK